MSKLNMRNGAIFENSPSGTWLIKFEKLSSMLRKIIKVEKDTIITTLVEIYVEILISPMHEDTGNQTLIGNRTDSS